MINIGLLSTYNNPMIGLYVNEISKKYNISCVILDSKQESEKDLKIWSERTNGRIPNLNLYKLNNLVPNYLINNHSSNEMVSLIKTEKINLLINCGTPRIIKEDVLKSPDIGVLNCHPGILPNYRGCTCVEWALYNNDELGNTCHLMTEEIDEGPIIFISKINPNNFDNYQSIRVEMYLDSIKSIIHSISLIENNKYNKSNYPKNGKYYKPISRDKMELIYKKYNKNNLK